MRGESLAVITGGDRDVPLHVEWAPPQPKQKGLDWSKIAPPADATVAVVPPKPPVPKCRNCGAVLVNKVCRTCTELEEARRDAEFAQPKPEAKVFATGGVVTPTGPALVDEVSVCPPALATDSNPVKPSLQFEWAHLLRDTADSTDRTIVSARFLALAALEHLRLAAASSAPAPRKAPTPRATASERPSNRGGSKVRANTAAILASYSDGNSINEVADITGHSRGTVRTHLLAAGVVLRDDRHTKSGGRNKRVDDPALVEQIRTMYEDEQLSQAQIGDRLGTTPKIVQGVMKRAGIKGREGQSGGGDTLVGIKDRIGALGVSMADVRAWAIAAGYQVNVRGVVPLNVLTAYEEAHR